MPRIVLSLVLAAIGAIAVLGSIQTALSQTERGKSTQPSSDAGSVCVWLQLCKHREKSDQCLRRGLEWIVDESLGVAILHHSFLSGSQRSMVVRNGRHQHRFVLYRTKALNCQRLLSVG